jgi:HAMP domain-containing protein
MSERMRTIILILLLFAAIWFIWFLKSEVGTNFVDTL